MVDLELLQQIRDLLINGMNGLDANELLHPADPHPDPVADPVDQAANLANPEAQAPEDMLISDHDVTMGSNIDED